MIFRNATISFSSRFTRAASDFSDYRFYLQALMEEDLFRSRRLIGDEPIRVGRIISEIETGVQLKKGSFVPYQRFVWLSVFNWRFDTFVQATLIKKPSLSMCHTKTNKATNKEKGKSCNEARQGTCRSMHGHFPREWNFKK